MVMIEQDDITGKVFKTFQMQVPYGSTPEQAQKVFTANQAAQQRTIEQVAAYIKQPKVIAAYAKAGIDVKTGQPISQNKTIAAKLDGTTVTATVADTIKGAGNSGLIILIIIAIAIFLIFVVIK
jgi:hypothetical protein